MLKICTMILAAGLCCGATWLARFGRDLWFGHGGFWWGVAAYAACWIGGGLAFAGGGLQWDNFIKEGGRDRLAERIANGVFAVLAGWAGGLIFGSGWALAGIGTKLSMGVSFIGLTAGMYLFLEALLLMLVSVVPSIDLNDLTRGLSRQLAIDFVGIVAMSCMAIRGCGGDSGHQGDSKVPPAERPVQAEVAVAVEEAKSAEEQVLEKLGNMGVGVGFDKKLNAAITVGTHLVELEDVSKLNEAFRQVAHRKALIDAICRIGVAVADNEPRCRDLKNDKGEVVGSEIKSHSKMPLRGLRILTSAESFSEIEGTYEFSLAVAWSPRWDQQAKEIVDSRSIGIEQEVGKTSIVEWVDGFAASGALPGARALLDHAGDRWLIGVVTVDDVMRRYMDRWFDGDKNEGMEYKLRAYALDGISKLLQSDVECVDEFGSRGDVAGKIEKNNGTSDRKPDETGEFQGDSDGFEVLYSTMMTGDKWVVMSNGLGEFDGQPDTKEDDDTQSEVMTSRFSREQKVCTAFRIDARNPRLKWFTRKAVNPISGKEIEVLVGAIRWNDVAVGEKERLSGGK